ncbi:MAG TPA: RDD family protein [Luteolibacter sp.]|nr:RDD family protein [Luteolibacter sp.]
MGIDLAVSFFLEVLLVLSTFAYMTTESNNPYASPISDPLIPVPEEREAILATLSERFGAAFLDGLISMLWVVPIWGILFAAGITKSFMGPAPLSPLLTTLVGVVSFGIFVLVQMKYLKTSGQTIGKKWQKIRIAKMDGSKPELSDLIWKRYVFFNFIALIPVVGSVLSLVNILLIFKKDRRCIHDLLAGTQVLKVSAAID